MVRLEKCDGDGVREGRLALWTGEPELLPGDLYAGRCDIENEPPVRVRFPEASWA